MYEFMISWNGVKNIFGSIVGGCENYTQIRTSRGITYTLEHKDILSMEMVA